MMITGTARPSRAPRSVRSTRRGENRAPLIGYWRRQEMIPTRSIRLTPTSTPGSTPMRKSLPTEMPPP